jgi:two-component system, NarL family, response regulator DegU
MPERIKIAVTDDQLLFRKGLISLLGEYKNFNVVFEAENGQDLLDKLKTKRIDVVILDLEMPVLNGIETTKLLKERYPFIKIVILTMHNEEEFVVELLRKGAHGFLLKDQDIELVVEAIYAVVENGFYFNPSISDKLVRGLINTNQIDPTFNKAKFTEKEREVIALICKELTNKEIADRTSLSTYTINGYVEKLFQKMGVRSRTGIVMYAMKHDITQNDFDKGF